MKTTDSDPSTGAKLSTLQAVALPTYSYLGGLPEADAIDALVDDALRALAELPGVNAQAVYGHASEELAAFGASVDLLILGSRGYGPVGRLVHGSTTHALARSARCPLLILTRVAREAGSDTQPTTATTV